MENRKEKNCIYGDINILNVYMAKQNKRKKPKTTNLVIYKIERGTTLRNVSTLYMIGKELIHLIYK